MRWRLEDGVGVTEERSDRRRSSKGAGVAGVDALPALDAKEVFSKREEVAIIPLAALDEEEEAVRWRSWIASILLAIASRPLMVRLDGGAMVSESSTVKLCCVGGGGGVCVGRAEIGSRIFSL